jgi:hypothetical protein
MQGKLGTSQAKKRTDDICAKLPLWLRILAAADSSALHFHHPYATSLPRKADDLLSWGEESVDALLGCTNLGHVARLEFGLIRRIAQVLMESKCVTGEEEVVYRKLLWARGVEISRSFPPWLGSTVAAGMKSPIMLPVLDLCNHSSDSTIEWKRAPLEVGNEEHVCFRTRVRIPKGEEVLINYGKDKSNEQLLWNYGFALNANYADTVTFNVSANLGCEVLCQQKARLLASLDVKVEVDDKKLSILSTILHPEEAEKKECMMADLGTLRAVPILMMGAGELESLELDKKGFDSSPVESESIEILCGIIQAKLEKLKAEEIGIKNRPRVAGIEASKAHERNLAAVYRHGQRGILEQALEELGSLLGDAENDGE